MYIEYCLKYEIVCWPDGMGVLIKGEFHDQECIQIGGGIREFWICWGFIYAKLEKILEKFVVALYSKQGQVIWLES